MNIDKRNVRALFLSASLAAVSLPGLGGCEEGHDVNNFSNLPAAGKNVENPALQIDELNNKIANLIDVIEKKVFLDGGFSGNEELKKMALKGFRNELKILDEYITLQKIELDQGKVIKKAKELVDRLEHFSLHVDRIQEVSEAIPNLKWKGWDIPREPEEAKPKVEESKPEKEEKKEKRRNYDGRSETMYA